MNATGIPGHESEMQKRARERMAATRRENEAIAEQELTILAGKLRVCVRSLSEQLHAELRTTAAATSGELATFRGGITTELRQARGEVSAELKAWQAATTEVLRSERKRIAEMTSQADQIEAAGRKRITRIAAETDQAQDRLTTLKRGARRWLAGTMLGCLLAVAATWLVIGWIRASGTPPTKTITTGGETYQVITEKGWTLCQGRPCKQIRE